MNPKLRARFKQEVRLDLNELVEEVEEKQRSTEEQAESLIKELEDEISELTERSTEVKQLSQSEDQLHLLQRFPSLKAAPPTKDWTDVSVRPPSYEGTVLRAASQLEETLSEEVKKLVTSELKRIQSFAVDVTLDPDTAHPELILSDDGKQDGYWTVWLRRNQYKALDEPDVHLSLKSQPEKVGVFVDYEEGLVSFYDVEAPALIYSFTGCCFTEKLCPYFGPGLNDGGKNSGPLIICPVNHTETDDGTNIHIQCTM